MTTGVFDCSVDEERIAGIDAAAAAVRRGELVVIPTDTVYGVAVDAFSPAAVNALLAAKGRGRDMPVPVLVSSIAMLTGVADDIGEAGNELAQRFWPGPLSLVVRHPAHLSWDLGDARGTVMVRIPDHEVALDLIARTGPLATSSANRSGHPPATTMLDARLQLGAFAAVYLDGGTCAAAVPSTIIDLTGDRPRALRIGVLDLEALRSVVPDIDGGDD